MDDVNAETLGGLELLPADDEEIPADADLEAAEASALADDPPLDPDPLEPLPLGYTWVFDWDVGEFQLWGDSPAEGTEEQAIIEWCQMAIHSARFAHEIFSGEFGMEEPEEPIGQVANADLLADIEIRLSEAWLVHDRIAAVTNFKGNVDPQTGVLTIENVDVVLDDETLLALGGISTQVEATI